MSIINQMWDYWNKKVMITDTMVVPLEIRSEFYDSSESFKVFFPKKYCELELLLIYKGDLND